MTSPKIAISRLKDIAILYEGDIHDIALVLLRVDIARTTPTCIPRHTLHGVANIYASIARLKLDDIERRLKHLGLPLGATVELDA